MITVHDGQCGTCTYFGADHSDEPKLVQIRITHKAEPDLVEPCGHPEHRPLDLQVTPVSGCAGYTPAKVA
ncbi:MAG: hypothetical protein LAT64_02735 [Phycisphaerales bacterium]|nr:hypothetical protein [Planctomycetota bacterium]MCH8507674.1 hypothetical protein [Phycisphaerales bacterium]